MNNETLTIEDLKEEELLEQAYIRIRRNKPTNFDRITESPEKLAELLDELGDCLIFQELGICSDRECRGRNCGTVALEWLQEECE